MGTRQLPLTENCPKPLLPFANIPLATHTVRLLLQQGVDEFIFLLHHLPERFPKVLGDGGDFGCRIKYVGISENLGTAGCVKYVENEIDRTSLIFSGDLIAEINLDAMMQSHRQRGAQISLAIRPEPLPNAYGVVEADAKGRIIRFQEKPSQAELFSNWISGGVYLVEPGFLKNFPSDGPLSFEREVFPFFAENRKPIYGMPLAGYWRDIGTPSSYLKAHEDFLDHKLPAVYYQNASQITSGGNLIGAKVIIDGKCTIEQCVIGDGCYIENGAALRNCVLWEGVRVGRDAVLERCIAANGARLSPGAKLSDKSIAAPTTEKRTGAYVGLNGSTETSKLDTGLHSSVTVQVA